MKSRYTASSHPASAARRASRGSTLLTLVPGVARGITMGGTLCLLASSLGTGTSWPARGGILLLENVNEEEYRLDRMLTSCAGPATWTGWPAT